MFPQIFFNSLKKKHCRSRTKFTILQIFVFKECVQKKSAAVTQSNYGETITKPDGNQRKQKLMTYSLVLFTVRKDIVKKTVKACELQMASKERKALGCYKYFTKGLKERNLANHFIIYLFDNLTFYTNLYT